LRIFVDARSARPRCTGVGVYTASMLQALMRFAPQGHFSVLTFKDSLLTEFVGPNVRYVATWVDYESHPLGDLYEHLVLPRIAGRLGADVFWGPAFQIPLGKTPFRKVVTIHDTTVFDAAKDYPKKFALYMKLVISSSIKSADLVACISLYTRARVSELFPDAESKCRVVYPPVAKQFFEAETCETTCPELPSHFILSIGAGSPRKNLHFGAKIVEVLRAAYGLDYEYVVVGNDPTLPSWVKQIPFVPHERLIPLYRKATLLLVPSTDEGFGFPAAEALATGCPAAVSNRGALPEVVADAGVVFSLEEGPEQAAEKVYQFLRDPQQIQKCIAAGKSRVRMFSEENSARALYALFESLKG